MPKVGWVGYETNYQWVYHTNQQHWQFHAGP